MYDPSLFGLAQSQAMGGAQPQPEAAPQQQKFMSPEEWQQYARLEAVRTQLENQQQQAAALRGQPRDYKSGTAGALGSLADILGAFGAKKLQGKEEENAAALTPFTGRSYFQAAQAPLDTNAALAEFLRRGTGV